MSDYLTSPVDDKGVIESLGVKKQQAGPNQELGKDAFLQLLSAQMRYQDPLNPSTDTQFVAQLATFTQLEYLQNLNNTTSQAQAFGLVGKTVIVQTKDSAGSVDYVSGKVAFVTVEKGEAQLFINGYYYPASDLYSVLDDDFVDSLGLPGIAEKAELEYSKEDPKDVQFKVAMGSDDNVADKVSIKINDKEIAEEHITVKDGVVTISKDALADLGIGKHKVEVTFNDKNKTKVTDMVTITVKEKGSVTEPEVPPEETK